MATRTVDFVVHIRKVRGRIHSRRRRDLFIDVTGWRYTRRWILRFRRGEWWIGTRRNLACDWREIGLLGLTICVPAERQPRTRAMRTRVSAQEGVE